MFSQRPLPDHLRRVTGVLEGDPMPQNGAELDVVKTDMNQAFSSQINSLTGAKKAAQTEKIMCE